MITALVLIRTEKGMIPKVASQLGEMEEVMEVLSVTGEYDLVAKIQVREYESLSEIVTIKLQETEGMLSTKTMMAFKTYKFIGLAEDFPPGIPISVKEDILSLEAQEGKKIAKSILSKLTQNIDLKRDEIFSFIDAINNNLISDVQVAGFLVALLVKGPSVKEVASIAKAMRKNCISIHPSVAGEMTDTCGTGGGFGTFNVSTSNAILTAAAGVPVAKHGSRSISSSSGSADVLEALGVNIEIGPDEACRLVEEIGISFLYAPKFHPVMLKVLAPEEQLGIKTIFFTIIGPLINPAGARNHMLGVYKPELVPMVADVIAEMDFNHVIVAHGMDGLDEISLTGRTSIAEIQGGKIKRYEITPEDFGLRRCRLEDIAGGDPDFNAAIIRDIFSGAEKGPRRDFLWINNAVTLYVSGVVPSIAEGIEKSRQLIDSGAAMKKLEELVRLSHQV